MHHPRYHPNFPADDAVAGTPYMAGTLGRDRANHATPSRLRLRWRKPAATTQRCSRRSCRPLGVHSSPASSRARTVHAGLSLGPAGSTRPRHRVLVPYTITQEVKGLCAGEPEQGRKDGGWRITTLRRCPRGEVVGAQNESRTRVIG